MPLITSNKCVLSIPELKYLQQIVISDNRFIDPGLRMVGGFVGAHDRFTGQSLYYP
jgi:hypothetical protein